MRRKFSTKRKKQTTYNLSDAADMLLSLGKKHKLVEPTSYPTYPTMLPHRHDSYKNYNTSYIPENVLWQHSMHQGPSGLKAYNYKSSKKLGRKGALIKGFLNELYYLYKNNYHLYKQIIQTGSSYPYAMPDIYFPILSRLNSKNEVLKYIKFARKYYYDKPKAREMLDDISSWIDI